MSSTELKRKQRSTSNSRSSSTKSNPSAQAISRRKPKNGDVSKSTSHWPSYFDQLFQVFKALNTVLAFCSSRKQLAVTYPVVKSSVESLMKRPMEMDQVTELKVLLPELITFGYIPREERRIQAESSQKNVSRKSRNRSSSPDYSAFLTSQSYRSGNLESEDHVLVLEFIQTGVGKKGKNPHTFSLPPSLTPKALQKLVDKRNERFIQAVNELLQVTPDTEDPVIFLQAASRDHIPINPTSRKPPSQLKQEPHFEIPAPNDRASIDKILNELQQADWYKDQIVERRSFPSKLAHYGKLNIPLSGAILQALRVSRNITSLYAHQSTAINAIRRGQHVIVSTSTASGKSVIYQVPMLQFLEEDLGAKGIFIYPTKALAQDQKAAFENLIHACPGLDHIQVATYDGDTAKDIRARIRDESSIIFTNFDTMHASILPQEDQWRSFLKNVKLVVVDELHYYSGLFGTHVAYVMRRFQRVCSAIGNRRLIFVSCSATIGQPMEHMKNIFGVDNVEVVIQDGAPTGEKEFLLWNPPPYDEIDPTLGRRSSLSEATGLMKFLLRRGVRTIMFCKIRKVCELAMKTIRAELSAEGRLDILERVMSYRGGYSPSDRRKIESDAFSGHLLGLIATNALELGVDIGSLDAVIMLGFPISIASMRQQAGRAGRRDRDALTILVADSLPIDQHYVQHPNELFDSPPAKLFVDLKSKVILEAHLQCAAFEVPMRLEDNAYFGEYFQEVCDTKLVKDKDGWYHTHPQFLPYPSGYISLRGIEEEHYTIIDVTRLGKGGQAKILEEIETWRALFETYEGAVFIHQGLTFLVEEVSHDSKIAKVARADVNWTTSPRDFTDVDAVQTYRIREIKGSPVHAYYGRVEIRTTVFGFFKIRNGAIIDSVDLHMPPFERTTSGLWIDVPNSALNILHLKYMNPAEAIHAAEHAIMNRFAMASDLRTECKAPEKEYMSGESQRKRPARLIFYDAAGQDVGIAAKAFDYVSSLVHEALEKIQTCECADGCSLCVCSASCKENNLVSSKAGAGIILRAILGQSINIDEIPSPTEPHEFPDTIINAHPIRAPGIEVEPYSD